MPRDALPPGPSGHRRAQSVTRGRDAGLVVQHLSSPWCTSTRLSSLAAGWAWPPFVRTQRTQFAPPPLFGALLLNTRVTTRLDYALPLVRAGLSLFLFPFFIPYPLGGRRGCQQQRSYGIGQTDEI